MSAVVAAVLAGLAKGWDLLKTPLGRTIALVATGVILVSLLLVGVHHSGVTAGVAKERAAEAKRLAAAVKKVAGREVTAGKITDAVKTDHAKERVRIQTVTRTLIQKVPVYVTPAADRACVVNLGFVRLHDAAASGSPPALPGPSGGPLDAPSGVQLSAVLGTVVGNYGVAYDWRAEALTWRIWYAQQKAAWEKP